MYITVNNNEKLKNLLSDIFTENFMKAYTNFDEFDYFKYASSVICNWDSPKMVYDEELLNLFVKESTVFESFDDMVAKATDIRFLKKQGDESNEKRA